MKREKRRLGIEREWDNQARIEEGRVIRREFDGEKRETEERREGRQHVDILQGKGFSGKPRDGGTECNKAEMK